MKNNKEFDQFIREKMQGLEPSLTPDSWDFLEQKMDAQETPSTDAVPENDLIDQVSYEKLHNFHQPYNKTHWELMAGKLEREFYFIQELLRVKTMEVSLMLLLLLILGRLIPGDLYKTPAINIDNRMIVENGQDFPASVDAIIDVVEERTVESFNVPEADVIPPTVVSLSSETNLVQAKDIFASVNKVPAIAQLPVAPIASMYGGEMDLPPVIIHGKSALVSALEQDAIALLENKIPEPGLEQKSFFDHDLAIRVGMFGGPNLDNIVNEPSIIGGEFIPSLNRYAMGYSGGISLGVGVNRFEVETGLVYTSKRYNPIEVQFIAGDLEKGFRNETFKFFEFNTLSVPVNLRYNFIDGAKWRIYAIAGGSAHFTAHAYYHIGTPVQSDDNRDETTTFGGRNSVIAALEKGLSDGIFQEGGFRENTYLSVNGGIGLERSVGDKWSFFTQTGYQHTFRYADGGLGPFKDVIHTFSISTGLKVRVNGK